VAALTIEGVSVPITASVGVASFPEDGASLPALFATADARLYQAKRHGRDRVVGAPAVQTAAAAGFR
jgi:diguanylate cyclase (GGDEF)-like protein